MLSELQNIKLPWGLTIERDLYESGTVAEVGRRTYPQVGGDER